MIIVAISVTSILARDVVDGFVLAPHGRVDAAVACFPTNIQLQSRTMLGAPTTLTSYSSPISRTIVLFRLYENNQKDNIEINYPRSDDDGGPATLPFLDVIGLIAQPVVWISLVSVATKGQGLPAGPFGLVGAIEGLSYLLVVVLGVVGPVSRTLGRVRRGGNTRVKDDDDAVSSLAESISLVTIILALLAVSKLMVGEGCIPNARPLFDYSDFVRVCDPS